MELFFIKAKASSKQTKFYGNYFKNEEWHPLREKKKSKWNKVYVSSKMVRLRKLKNHIWGKKHYVYWGKKHKGIFITNL